MIRDIADGALTRVIDGTRYGRMMVLSNDRYMGAAFSEFGEYSESEVALWRQLLEPDAICADIGANIGAHTVALASLVPAGMVVAFEPLPYLHSILHGNIALNGLTNVRAFPHAVGATAGRITVPALDYTQRDNYGGVSLVEQGVGNPVMMVRLDDVMAVCDFMKVDVEGMEQSVLEGAQRLIAACRPILYLENNPGPGQQVLIPVKKGLGNGAKAAIAAVLGVLVIIIGIWFIVAGVVRFIAAAPPCHSSTPASAPCAWTAWRWVYP